MLNSIRIQNYKCFCDHVIDFKKITIAIGQNNAGKSTLIEVIRLISLVSSKFKGLIYHDPPDWTNLNSNYQGIRPGIKGIEVELDLAFYRYGEPPSIITALFTNGSMITIYIGPNEDIFSTIQDSKGNIIRNKAYALKSDVETIHVLPQITPLLQKEILISDKTVKRNLFSRRMSSNFRNQIFLFKDTIKYCKLNELLSETWPKLALHNIYLDGNIIKFMLREPDFVAEIFDMGHGIQMWLQTIWFLSQIEGNSIVVLDEPDVYMHPDLQRTLIRILKNKYNQIVIATHSVEIISEVEPNNILIIDKNESCSVFADTIPTLQSVLDGMGSVHNIQLYRLLQTKLYLFVEGNDIDILKRLQNTLNPDSNMPLDTISSISTGGWSSWDIRNKDAIRLLNTDSQIRIYFIYDGDYHTPEEIETRKKYAKSNGINLFIWSKKEIENYLIVPSAIQRFISQKIFEYSCPTIDEITQLINDVCEDMKQETYEKLIDSYSHREKGKEFSYHKRIVDKFFLPQWDSFEYKISVISGKTAMSKLSAQCKQRYNVSFGILNIASILSENEIHEDVKRVISSIEGKVTLYNR